ncbi:diphthine synthase [archaeon]|jgi:diphthine methyl ester synthase|nr:diphthine synthase [archaeon]MBT4351051.1 diphthine synthase [archaeon]MBT4647799.1 diphthine synthase [archaeon]MBT7391812.1 diphthine synthase [archaeon]
MTLYLIGLGLNDEKDITIKGLEAIKNCDYIYLESYTSLLLNTSIEKLEKLYGKKIIIADRELVEKKSDEILDNATQNNVAFLVVGDVFSATTHTDLFLRAKEKNIDIKIIHNTSILTAVGDVGLELYKYGKTTSMPYFEKGFEPETPYDVIKQNKSNGLHTLVLLDIKPDRKMTVYEAISQLLQIQEKRTEKIFTSDLMIVGCARLGSDNFTIKYGKVQELQNNDFGKPLHCLIVPGKLHFMEEDMLGLWK